MRAILALVGVRVSFGFNSVESGLRLSLAVEIAIDLTRLIMIVMHSGMTAFEF